MPGNEVEDRIRKLYELDNSSPDQQQSQAVEGSWPAHNYNQGVGKQRHIGAALSFNLKNCNVQRLDSLKEHGSESLSLLFKQKYTQLIQRPEFSSIYSRNQLLNSNGDMLGCPKLQATQRQSESLGENTVYDPHAIISRGSSFLIPHRENVSGDSPTVTTNSEKSEITETSFDFDFIEGKQPLFRGQQLNTPQSHLMQQSGYNDMQLLQQQHMVFKQLQELQRQQQLQHLGDARPQNSSNQISAMAKQATGAHSSPVINGMPVNDASHMYMNWMQRGAFPAVQGGSNRATFSQDQGQALRSMGLASQQLDVSLYGTPVASARGSMSPYSHLHGMSRDSSTVSTKVSVQGQKPIMQSSGYQVTVSSEQVCFPQEGFVPKQRSLENNMFSQVPGQGLNSAVISGKPQQGNTLQKNAAPMEFNARQEQAGWSGNLQQKDLQLGPSQGLVPLDPMEEKILYNLDDNIWDASFGRCTDMGVGGFGAALEHTDYPSAFPSIQSGSWSALMQSAVAEASSSDTGPQEEWSGLTFQNTELSTDNQPSNVMDSEKQQSSWLDNNLLNTSSLSSKPFPVFNDSSVSSSFPGFHQPGIKFSIEQRDTLHQDDSHESIQKSPKNTGEWIDCGPKQKSFREGSQQAQPLMHLDNAWAGQIFKHQEGDFHQQRISPCNNVSQPCSEIKGDVNEATYKGRGSDDYLWEVNSNCGVSSFSRSAGGLEQAHSGMNSTLPNREDSQIFNFAAVPNSSPSKAFREASQQVQDNNQLEYVKHVDTSRNKENQSIGKNQHQMSNGSHVLHNYLLEAGGTYEMQQKCYLKDNSYCNYGSKGLIGQEQECVGQLKLISDVSSSPVTLDKLHLPDFEGNSKASETASRGCLNTSTTFQSENMLELLHKVDQSKENSKIPHFGSRGCDSLVSDTGTPDGSDAQLYHQSAASQGFTLKLAPPSQQLFNMNPFISSQDFPEAARNLSFRQANSEIGDKNQTWPASPSFQSSPSPRESSQRLHWDNKFSTSVQTRIPSSLYMPGSSIASFESSPLRVRNQLQTQGMLHAPPGCPSAQAILPGTVSRYPSFNLDSSQDTSPRIFSNSSGQQFHILEAKPVSNPPVMSGMHQQGAFSARLPNLWTNVPVQQRILGVEPHKVLSMDLSTNSLETSLAPLGLNELNSQKVGYGTSEFSASPRSSQGFEHGVNQQEKERSQLQISSEIFDASQTGNLPRNISHANAFASGSLLPHSHLLNLDRIQHEDNAPSPSERNLETIDHSLKSSHVFRPNYSLLPQVQAMKNANTEPSRRVSDVEHVTAMDGPQLIYEDNSRSRNQIGPGLMSASPLNSMPSGDTKMQSFLTEAREDFGIKASPQPALLDRSQGVVTFSQNDLLSQSTARNVASNDAGHPQVNLHTAPAWFKQYEAFRNGLMPPTNEAGHAKNAAGQFSIRKPPHNLNVFSSREHIDAADASQSGRLLPSSTLVVSESFSAPYSLPSDDTEQCMVVARPKKRKTAMSDLLPWWKEVTQGSRRVQNISVAEHEWAQATNRLTEKVEDEAELIEDRQSMLRPKKRLILTTQIMQQLLCPAPISILFAKGDSQYDVVGYFVAKLSLGDACSLTTLTSNGLLHVPTFNNNFISEKQPKVIEGVDDQFFLKVVEDLSNRAKKLENDLVRLDKVSSILDVRVDCQELEKFSVINRFAKFHIRQADSSGTSSSSSAVAHAPKPFPQRYVVAHPIPRNLPEGLQCLSL